MLKQILTETNLSTEFCANLLRVPEDQFRQWLDGKAPVPHFVIQELSAVLGVSEKVLQGHSGGHRSGNSAAPAIWFKLGNTHLTAADREMVAMVRRMGFFAGQLDDAKGARSSASWSALADNVLKGIDRSAPPSEQGREAAIRFRSILNLNHGKTGVGELIRPLLRNQGLLVMETSIPKSALEGCCFNVGREPNVRPCVFANSHSSTWFRRNEVLLHETAHAIFDLSNDPVPLDFRSTDSSEEVSTAPIPNVSETRAQAFAQEVLVSGSVLNHYSNQFGINWDRLSATDLARLMAATHAEKKLVLRSAVDNGLLKTEMYSVHLQLDCKYVLSQFSSHQLNTREYLAKQAIQSPKWRSENRTAKVGIRSLRLPVGYVQRVIDAANEGLISYSKAAERVMMDRYAFLDRFGDLISEIAVG